MAKPTILVTGAGGQLGQELNESAPFFPQFHFVFLSKEDLPVHDAGSIRKLFEHYHPQFCINCAAYTAVDKAESEKELAFLVNGKAVGILASVCKEYQCRLFHFSTDYVFDGTASVPYKEGSPVNPQSVYGASKLEGEKQAMKHDPDSIIIRTSWVYSSFGKNFVKTMLKLMNEKEEVNVVNDQIGSPTYAADLAEVILQIIVKLTIHHSPVIQGEAKETIHGIYHYTNDGIISWYDFAVAIKELSESKCRVNAISTSQYPTTAKRPAYSVLDKTKIQHEFSIQLKDWKKSLAICVGKISNQG